MTPDEDLETRHPKQRDRLVERLKWQRTQLRDLTVAHERTVKALERSEGRVRDLERSQSFAVLNVAIRKSDIGEAEVITTALTNPMRKGETTVINILTGDGVFDIAIERVQ